MCLDSPRLGGRSVDGEAALEKGSIDRDQLHSVRLFEADFEGFLCYEFGVKVAIVTTNARAPGGQFVLHAKALPGNPYDGHTLAGVIEATERLTGCTSAAMSTRDSAATIRRTRGASSSQDRNAASLA